jgi:hypothetical protein
MFDHYPDCYFWEVFALAITKVNLSFCFPQGEEKVNLIKELKVAPF